MKIKVWCEPDNVPLIKINANKKMPNLIRCEKCKKRFAPIVYDCGDGGCWHACLPKHKKTVKV